MIAKNLKHVYMDHRSGRRFGLQDARPTQKSIFKGYRRRDLSQLNPWIRLMIAKQITEVLIEILFDQEQPGILPTELFLYQTMTVLKLNCNFILPDDDIIHLPSLRALHLTLDHHNRHVVGRFLTGCSQLEELSLYGKLFRNRDDEHNIAADELDEVYANLPKLLELEPGPPPPYQDEQDLIISSQTLTMIKLHFVQCSMTNYKVVIDGPALKTLTVWDGFSLPKYSIEDFRSCKNNRHIFHMGQCLQQFYGARLYGLLVQPTTVTFFGHALTDWNLLHHKGPRTFGGLTHLRINLADSLWGSLWGSLLWCYEAIPYILKCFPSLEALYLVKRFLPSSSLMMGRFQFPEWAPECVMFRLKEIEFVGFRPFDRGYMKLLHYFLKHGMALSRVKVNVDPFVKLSPEENNALQKIYSFGKASQSCELVINDQHKQGNSKPVEVVNLD